MVDNQHQHPQDTNFYEKKGFMRTHFDNKLLFKNVYVWCIVKITFMYQLAPVMNVIKPIYKT